MAQTTVCDRCGSTVDVDKAEMTSEGIHRPKPGRRQDGIGKPRDLPDICHSCLVSLSFKWAAVK